MKYVSNNPIMTGGSACEGLNFTNGGITQQFPTFLVGCVFLLV